MHYQVVFEQDLLGKTHTHDTGLFINGESKRFFTTLLDHNESVLYDVYDGHLVIIRETNEGEVEEYLSDRSYDYQTLPLLVAIACYKHNKRVVKMGRSTHTLMFHDNKDGRFEAVLEAGKVTLHDKEGLVFTQDGDYYLSLPEEHVANIMLERLNHSLKFFDEKYKVRFKIGRNYAYFPLTEVFADPEVRNIRLKLDNLTITQPSWDRLREQLMGLLEDYTQPTRTVRMDLPIKGA